MAAELKTSLQGQTLVLTLSNPEFRNALGPEIYAGGMAALKDASKPDSPVRSVVITGEGGIFCAGGNLNRIKGNREKPRETQAASIELMHGWIEALRACPRPVIAAVEGPAAGAGFALALSCDFIVSASNAVFVMAYSSVALSADGGGSWSLMRALPRQLATELLMLGEKISPQRLHELGIVNRLAEPGQALADALKLAGKLNARAPNALASAKALAADLAPRSMTEHLAQERDHFVNNLHHANGGEGIDAFLEKRPASYQ
jgi:enoyl-CoA hydratase/carnithine racemase